MFCIVVLIIFAVGINQSYQQVCPQQNKCFWKFPYFLTRHLECDVFTQNCQLGFMCCWNCHFSHPVCVRTASPTTGVLPFGLNRPSLGYNRPKISEKNYYMNVFPMSKMCDMPNNEQFNNFCRTDLDCPGYHVCWIEMNTCTRKNFEQEAASVVKTTVAVKIVEDNLNCPVDTSNCNEKDIIYKCDSDEDCYDYETCCYSVCYESKICKNRIKTVTLQSECPGVDNETNCFSKEVKGNVVSKCESNGDCLGDQICCEEPCSGYKMCTSPKTQIEKARCPKADEKCVVPYSLRIEAKYKCVEDGDCKLGSLCCEDPCNDYFKVCTRVTSSDNYKTNDYLMAIFKAHLNKTSG